jgi:hypothetical protein
MSKIGIDQAPDWIRKLAGEREEAARRGLLSAGHRLVSVIVTEIIPKEPRIPVDRGIYRAGWRVRRDGKDVLVYNATPHAALIEDGVRGDRVKVGKAMIEALAAWVTRKGIGGVKKQGRDASGHFTNAIGADARRVAWAIAQSMRKKGIFDGGKGLGILRKARPRIPAIIDEEVRAELRGVRA